jgi:hypothetical protein
LSTLRIDNFGPSAGGTTYSARGIAKAWVSASDAAVLQDSLNVSSGTDNGVGDYTYAFSSVMDNTNYGVVTACADGGVPVFSANVSARSAASYNVQHGYTSTAPAYVDEDLANYSAVFGDLA